MEQVALEKASLIRPLECRLSAHFDPLSSGAWKNGVLSGHESKA
jgi:hypothetical protein